MRFLLNLRVYDTAANALEAIPMDTTSLFIRIEDSVPLLLQVIPLLSQRHKITDLDLGVNNLAKKPTAELVQMLAALKETQVTRLDLSHNCLYEKKTDDFIKILQSLKDTKVRTLILCLLPLDGIFDCYRAKRIELSKNLPENIQSLQISGSLRASYFYYFISALPDNIIELNLNAKVVLSYNEIKWLKDVAKINNIISTELIRLHASNRSLKVKLGIFKGADRKIRELNQLQDKFIDLLDKGRRLLKVEELLPLLENLIRDFEKKLTIFSDHRNRFNFFASNMTTSEHQFHKIMTELKLLSRSLNPALSQPKSARSL